MMTNLMKLLRLVVAALLLAFVAVPAAEAGERTRTSTTARTESRPKRTGDSERGLLVIAGAVALLLFLAWVAVRIGDNSRSADKIPS